MILNIPYNKAYLKKYYHVYLCCKNIMETQINDNFKNNKKSINLISDKDYIKGMIT